MNLNEMIDDGRRYLVVGRNRSTLTSREQLLLTLGRMGPVWAVFDMGRARESLLRLAGPEERTYDVREVAAAAGVSPCTISLWCREQTIRASIRENWKRGPKNARLFSFNDTLIAATIGSLRRQGVPPRAAQKLAQYLYGMVEEVANNAVGV